MPKKQRRRKRPGRHTVHTKDPRFNVKNYPRGSGDLVTREGVTKTQHAWDVDDGMVASPIHGEPNDEWRGDHNRSDVVNVDYHPDEASPEVVKAQLKKYRLWLGRLQSAGMRDPDNPSKSLPPSHPLTKLRIERNKTEIKYYEGKLTLPQYQRAIELLEQKEKVVKKRLSDKKAKKKKPESKYFKEYTLSDGDTAFTVSNSLVKGESAFYNFDLSSVESKSAWRGFLKKHGFKKVADDPDKDIGRGRRKIYKNPRDIFLVVGKEVGERDGELALSYMRFETPKSKRPEMLKILKDFRGPRALEGTDIQGEDLGGIATYVKEENANTEYATFI